MHSAYLGFGCLITYFTCCVTQRGWHLRVDSGLRLPENAGPSISYKTDADAGRNVSELITSKGYPCENYVVTTADGFILSLQRISHGKIIANHHSADPKPVVFLQHGLLDSAATWVMDASNQSLGFILADNGFDVWLGNVRGNTYSRNHIKFDPSDARFWQWSWDEMVTYDLPAMLDFVLKTTGQANLFYIGHSQGSLIAFNSFSHNKQLSSKIKALIALGPVFTVSHVQGIARFLVEISPETKTLFDIFGIHEFLPSDSAIRILAKTLCGVKISQPLCENIIFLICGFNYKQFNMTRLPVYLSHTPAGTSVQNVVHFAQMVQSKKCQKFDFGSDELNVQHYNQTSPPLYNVSSLDVPTFLFSGTHDWLADTQDVKELASQLKCLVSHEVIPGWQHLDFLWAVDAAPILYTKIVKILQHIATTGDYNI